MRYFDSTLRFFALLTAAAVVAACGGGGDSAPAAESAAAASPPAAAAESFTIVAEDASWSADITPTNIVWRRTRGARDSLVFDYKAPNVAGSFYEFESLRLANDTTRISINLAGAACTDASGAQYSFRAQVWLTGGTTLTGSGCANKKM